MRQRKPRPTRKPWDLNTRDLCHEKVYAQKRTRRYELFFNYLRLSPTYLMALHCQDEVQFAERLGDAERASKVWKIRVDVGNVFEVMFKTWWLSCGINLFGIHTKRPQVELITHLAGKSDDTTLIAEAQERMADFIPSHFTEQGRPDSVLVSIPLGQARIKTSRELYELIAKIEAEAPVKLPAPQYMLENNKIQDRRLEKGYDLVFYKTVFPQTELWRAGALARISDKHIDLDPLLKKKNAMNAEARRGLTMLASRLYNETITIVENAAIGKFPSLDAIDPPNLDPRFSAFHQGWLSQVEAWEREERFRMEQEEQMQIRANRPDSTSINS